MTTRIEHFRAAEQLLAEADQVEDKIETLTGKADEAAKAEAHKLADRLVAKAHVRALLSTVERVISQ